MYRSGSINTQSTQWYYKGKEEEKKVKYNQKSNHTLAHLREIDERFLAIV